MSNRDMHYLNICYELARKSPCVKAQFGSVVVDYDGEIVGRGFNRSPNPACQDCAALCAGKLRQGVKSGTRLELCYATHAEQWAILDAGLRAKGSRIYVAGFISDGSKAKKDKALPLGNPGAGFYCSFCARIIWAAGCISVICDSVDGPYEQSLESIWETSFSVASSVA